MLRDLSASCGYLFSGLILAVLLPLYSVPTYASDNIIYVALSRQMALFREMDVIANNIANANTAGYKGEAMVFREHVMEVEAPGGGGGEEPGFPGGETEEVSYTIDAGLVRDQKQGPLLATSRQLDVAINGEGLFEITLPEETAYTRAGNFQINESGELITTHGYPVAGVGGPIVFDPNDFNIVIDKDGVVGSRIGGTTEQRGTIKIVKFEDYSELQKQGESLFILDPESENHTYHCYRRGRLYDRTGYVGRIQCEPRKRTNTYDQSKPCRGEHKRRIR